MKTNAHNTRAFDKMEWPNVNGGNLDMMLFRNVLSNRWYRIPESIRFTFAHNFCRKKNDMSKNIKIKIKIKNVVCGMCAQLKLNSIFSFRTVSMNKFNIRQVQYWKEEKKGLKWWKELTKYQILNCFCQLTKCETIFFHQILFKFST